MTKPIAQMTRDELVIYCYDNAPEVYKQIKPHHTASDICAMLENRKEITP